MKYRLSFEIESNEDPSLLLDELHEALKHEGWDSELSEETACVEEVDG
jgi:hypothetical protein